MIRALAAAVLATATLAACGGASSAQEFSYVSDDGATVILPASERTPAPEMRGPTLKDGAFEGPEFNLADHRGKVVVVNVWASWCGPCRKEAPVLARAATELEPGVVFLGLNTRDSPVSAQAFVDRFAIPYPSIEDADGRIQLGFRDSLLPTAIGSTVLIDKQGRVAARAIGGLDISRVRGLVEPLQREGA